VGLPNEAPAETKIEQDLEATGTEDASPSLVTTSSTLIGDDPFEDQDILVQEEEAPTPDAIPNGEQPETCLPESGEMASAGTNHRDNATGSCSDESDQDVVLVGVRQLQVELSADAVLAGFAGIKIEPDW
jgi:hypothetical protein